MRVEYRSRQFWNGKAAGELLEQGAYPRLSTSSATPLPYLNPVALIANVRKEQGLSFAQMAAQSGIHEQTLRNWACGKHPPTRRGLQKLPAILD